MRSYRNFLLFVGIIVLGAALLVSSAEARGGFHGGGGWGHRGGFGWGVGIGFGGPYYDDWYGPGFYAGYYPYRGCWSYPVAGWGYPGFSYYTVVDLSSRPRERRSRSEGVLIYNDTGADLSFACYEEQGRGDDCRLERRGVVQVLRRGEVGRVLLPERRRRRERSILVARNQRDLGDVMSEGDVAGLLEVDVERMGEREAGVRLTGTLQRRPGGGVDGDAELLTRKELRAIGNIERKASRQRRLVEAEGGE